MTHTTFSAHLTRSARQIFNVLFAFAALACAAPAAQAQNILLAVASCTCVSKPMTSS